MPQQLVLEMEATSQEIAEALKSVDAKPLRTKGIDTLTVLNGFVITLTPLVLANVTRIIRDYLASKQKLTVKVHGIELKGYGPDDVNKILTTIGRVMQGESTCSTKKK